MSRHSNFLDADENMRDQNLKFVRNDFEDNINQYFTNGPQASSVAPPRDYKVVQPVAVDSEYEDRKEFFLQLGLSRKEAVALTKSFFQNDNFNLKYFKDKRHELRKCRKKQSDVDTMILSEIYDIVDQKFFDDMRNSVDNVSNDTISSISHRIATNRKSSNRNRSPQRKAIFNKRSPHRNVSPKRKRRNSRKRSISPRRNAMSLTREIRPPVRISHDKDLKDLRFIDPDIVNINTKSCRSNLANPRGRRSSNRSSINKSIERETKGYRMSSYKDRQLNSPSILNSNVNYMDDADEDYVLRTKKVIHDKIVEDSDASSLKSGIVRNYSPSIDTERFEQSASPDAYIRRNFDETSTESLALSNPTRRQRQRGDSSECDRDSNGINEYNLNDIAPSAPRNIDWSNDTEGKNANNLKQRAHCDTKNVRKSEEFTFQRGRSDKSQNGPITKHSDFSNGPKDMDFGNVRIKNSAESVFNSVGNFAPSNNTVANAYPMLPVNMNNGNNFSNYPVNSNFNNGNFYNNPNWSNHFNHPIQFPGNAHPSQMYNFGYGNNFNNTPVNHPYNYVNAPRANWNQNTHNISNTFIGNNPGNTFHNNGRYIQNPHNFRNNMGNCDLGPNFTNNFNNMGNCNLPSNYSNNLNAPLCKYKAQDEKYNVDAQRKLHTEPPSDNFKGEGQMEKHGNPAANAPANVEQLDNIVDKENPFKSSLLTLDDVIKSNPTKNVPKTKQAVNSKPIKKRKPQLIPILPQLSFRPYDKNTDTIPIPKIIASRPDPQALAAIPDDIKKAPRECPENFTKPYPEYYWPVWWKAYKWIETDVTYVPGKDRQIQRELYGNGNRTIRTTKRTLTLYNKALTYITRSFAVSESDYYHRNCFKTLKCVFAFLNKSIVAKLPLESQRRVKNILKRYDKAAMALLYQGVIARYAISAENLKRNERGENMRDEHASYLLTSKVFHWMVRLSIEKLKEITAEEWSEFETEYPKYSSASEWKNTVKPTKKIRIQRLTEFK